MKAVDIDKGYRLWKAHKRPRSERSLRDVTMWVDWKRRNAAKLLEKAVLFQDFIRKIRDDQLNVDEAREIAKELVGDC